MKNFKHIFCSAILILSITVSSIPFTAYSKEGEKVVIYHTNDMHARVNSIYKENELTQIGLDMVRSVKDNTENSILIDAGDATQGAPMGKYSKGIDIIDVMNAAGYDGMTLGNHEFDYGKDAVMKIAQEAKFPVVAANILYNDKTFLEGVNGYNGCNFIKEINGKKIGFFGIATEETTRTTIPLNLEGISFKDEIETSKQQTQALRNQGADLVVGIMHIGVDSSSKLTSRDVAKEVPDIDIIIDGHSHSKMTETVGKTLIQQTGTGSNTLGKIEIDFSSSSPSFKSELMLPKEIGENYSPNEEVTSLYDSRFSKIEPVLSKVVGKTATNLYGGNYSGKNVSRMVETNLGSLIGDSMLFSSKKLLKNTKYKAMPIVAMENGGAVRSKINKGFITMENILEVLPLDNRLSLQIVTPSVLYQTMERGVSKQNLPSELGEPIDGFFGGFPQISGMRIEYDLTKQAYNGNEPGNRVTKIVILDEDGSDAINLDRNDTMTPIILACNDYTITEYPMIKDIDVVIKGDYLSEVLANYINVLTMKGGGEFSFTPKDQRVKLLKSNDLFGDYSADVLIEENNVPIGLKEVEVKVDDNKFEKMSTNEIGLITLNDLKSGGHNVTVKYGSLCMDAYVDETVGIKTASIDVGTDSDKNVKSVINLIDQIPENPQKTDQRIISLAKTSYDSLSQDEKDQVTNADVLFSSAEILNDNILTKNIIMGIVVVVLVIICAFIIRLIKKMRRNAV